MTPSSAWREFLAHLREITELLRADPSSNYSERKSGQRTTNLELSGAITKGAMSLTSGRLQGCVVSQVQEFLERIDQSGISVEQIPEILRGHLALSYPKSAPNEEKVRHAITVQQANAPLWTPGITVQPGMIKTSSLPDRVWNPWPRKVDDLLSRCDIDLFGFIEQEHGAAYLANLKTYVDDLVEFRNKVAHGDEPQPLGASDVRRSMRWAIRLARAADGALARKLTEITGEPAW
jgi:hypothetical protein